MFTLPAPTMSMDRSPKMVLWEIAGRNSCTADTCWLRVAVDVAWPASLS